MMFLRAKILEASFLRLAFLFIKCGIFTKNNYEKFENFTFYRIV